MKALDVFKALVSDDAWWHLGRNGSVAAFKDRVMTALSSTSGCPTEGEQSKLKCTVLSACAGDGRFWVWDWLP